MSGEAPTNRPSKVLLSYVIKAIFHVVWKTCRVVVVDGAQHLQRHEDDAQPVIPCYWHQQQIFCARYLIDSRLQLGYLISPSGDGDMATRMFSNLGLRIVRGSASREGAKTLRDIYLVIKQEGVSPIVTPDGPRGPIFECKPGVAMLAQLTGAPILPLAYSASHQWRLRSWDRFIIPWPFARIAIVIGEPVEVPRGGSLETAAETVTDRLNRASEAAKAHLKAS